MSFDIIVLKPMDLDVNDLTEVNEVLPLGSHTHVAAAFDQTFPGSLERPFVVGEEFSVEFALGADPVESAHVTLRFGDSWSSESDAQFHALLAQVCRALGGVAFAVSDNTRVAP